MIGLYALHASHPPKDGGSIRSWELSRLLAGRVLHEFIAREGVWTNSITHQASIRAPRGGKVASGLRTLLHRSHYVLERHVGREAKAYLSTASSSYEAVYANFIWSLTLPGADKIAYIDTHNSEEQWFRNIAEQSNSTLTRAVCRCSLNYALELLKKAPGHLCLIHVSEEDAAWYRKTCPQARHVIVPNGCQVTARPTPTPGRKRRAYFLGSLSVSMNNEALHYLARFFWPSIRDLVEITVIGSNPGAAVVKLCAEQGWQLRANPDTEELNNLLAEQEIALLPFARSAGSKLKFYDALGRGMLVAATSSVSATMGQLPPTVYTSDTALGWREAIQGMPELGRVQIMQSQEYAQRYTWTKNYTSFLDADPGPLGKLWRGEKI